MSYKTPLGREQAAMARAGWQTLEGGKRRLRTDVGPIRVSTREDGPRDYLLSVKPIAAAQHEGYVDLTRTLSRPDAELAHRAAVQAIRAVIGDDVCQHHGTAESCSGCQLALAMVQHFAGVSLGK